MKKFLTFILLCLLGTVAYSQDDCDEPDSNKKHGNPDAKKKPKKKISIPIVHSFDPNIVIGPEGYDTIQWVSGEEVLPYKIMFENDPEFASAPAQTVTIYMPIHEGLEPSSFRVGSFGFGNYVFSVPPNTSTYNTRVDVRDQLGLYVDVLAGVDYEENRAFWILKSIDPETGLLPEDAFSGFLPINDTTESDNDTILGAGEGFVNFSIRCNDRVKTRDSVNVQAGIVFDSNEPVMTNTWTNIVDAGAPATSVQISSQDPATSEVTLSFTGQDDTDGVGIKDYSLYVSENEASFYLHEEGIEAETYVFAGKSDGEYCFFSTARDWVNNEEAEKECEASVKLEKTDSLLLTSQLDTMTYCTNDTMLIEWKGSGVTSLTIYLLNQQGETSVITEYLSENDDAFEWVLSPSMNLDGEYYIVLKDEGKAMSDTSSLIYIRPFPETPQITPENEVELCMNDSVLLKSNYEGGNTWLPGNRSDDSIYVDTPGKYYLRYENEYGCVSEWDSVEVIQVPDPIASFTFEQNDFELTFTNTSQYGESFQWFFGNGDTSTVESPIYEYNEKGMYLISLIASNSCASDTAYEQVNLFDISNGELPVAEGVDIYPNPTRGEFRLSYKEDGLQVVLIEIYNLKGIRVYQEVVDRENAIVSRIDATRWKSGTYIVRLVTDKGTLTKELVRD